ncbi:MAG: hypothetical protein ABIZ52_03895 [Candidatus Limnocylindrales bacterium]
MLKLPRRRSRTLLALVACVALVSSACSSAGVSTASPGAASASTTLPPGSGSAPCPTAPAVSDSLEGWGPPTTPPDVVPLIIASAGELVCGANRVLFTILDKDGRPIGAPDRTTKVAIYDLGRDATKPIATLDGAFIWAIENERGVYVINATFPDAGRYGAEFTTAAAGGAPATVRLTFDVQPSSDVVKIGDKAPASKTPILADVGGDATHISTDAKPDPAFYETSVDQAVAAHKPFVVIFATPKFCTSAQCGPTLDRIKPFVAKYPSVTFINVEPYKLKLVDGVLQADVDAGNQLQTTAVTDEWRLLTEPIVFVIDRTGTVTASFELIFSEAELTRALDAVK